MWTTSICDIASNSEKPQTLKDIQWWAFGNCTSLQSIVIPESVNRIRESAFEKCSVLKTIAIPKHAIIGDGAFAHCNMLDRANEPNITKWLKMCFDQLPLYQLCYNINENTIDKLASIQINNQALTEKDAMDMTPLHR